MKLAFIEMVGFRGVKNALKLNVPSGFLVIVGRNGSGKTTLCDAIEFGLTGSIRENGHKEKGESYADYLWWRGAGTVPERFVRLGFRDATGELYTVTRTPKGLDAESEATLGRLYRQDGAPNQPLTGLCRTSLIRDEEITNLSVDLPESDRYRFVRDALGTVQVSDIEVRIEVLKSTVENRLRKEQPSYDRLRDRVADMTTRLSELRASLSSVVDNQSVEQNLRTLLHLPDAPTADLLEAARASLSQQRIQLDRLHRLLASVQELTTLQQTIETESYLARQRELETQLAEAESRLANLNSECEQRAAEVAEKRKDEPVRSEQAELLEHGERVGLLPDSRCPLCGSTVADHSFHEHITSVRDQIKNAATEIVNSLAHQTDSIKRRDEALRRRDILKRQHTEHLSHKNVLASLIAETRQQAEAVGLATSDEHLSADQVRNHIEALRGRTCRLEEGVGWLETSSVTEVVQSLEAELEEAKARANEAFATTSRTEKAIGKLKEAHKITRSLIGEIIDEQLSELSPLIEEIYRRLRPHVEWTSIKYRLRGDVRRMLSFEVGDGLNPSFVFSSGQRRAAGLAFLLAVHLSRPWCEWNSLLLDDPVQHVDDFRALNLTEVLSAVRKGGRQIVCCVEDEALGKLMCRRLRSETEHDGAMAQMNYDCELGVTVRNVAEVGPMRRHVLVSA
jgi:chromosome segregation protein